MQSGHNLGSIFDPVVSVEAWRTKCSATDAGSVHLDVTFLEAYLGDEPESQLRFQVALSRAVVKVFVSARDPITVVRESVDRGTVQQFELEKSQNRQAGFDFTASAAVKTSSNPVDLNVGGAANFSHEKTQQLTGKFQVTDKEIAQYYDDNSYCWEVRPRNDQILRGKVWDAVREPRFKTLLKSATAKSADCEVRLIIECRRQDIAIRNITLKEKRLSLAAFRDSKNNLAAAESALKSLICQKGFAVNNFSEPFNLVRITELTIPED